MAEAGVNSKTVRVNAKVEAQNAKMECPRSNASTDKWNEESRVFAQRSAHSGGSEGSVRVKRVGV